MDAKWEDKIHVVALCIDVRALSDVNDEKMADIKKLLAVPTSQRK